MTGQCRYRFSARRRFFVVGVLAAVAFSFLMGLTGCGGGFPQASITTPTALHQGRAVFTVQWPVSSRLIPAASNSIQVKATSLDGARLLGSGLLTRPVGGGQARLTLDHLPVGDVVMTAAAYPDTTGAGVVQAQASVTVTVLPDQIVPVVLAMASTIDHIDIAPAVPFLTVGDNVQLVPTPRNASGEVVLVSSGTLQWNSQNSGVATVDGNGQVAAVAPGTATILVKETESNKQASVLVTVTAPVVKTGELYVSGFYSYDVQVLDSASGNYLRTFVPPGTSGLKEPHAILFGPDGLVYVSSDELSGVMRFRADTGAFVDNFVHSGANGGMDNAAGMIFGKDGNLLVCSVWTNQVKRFSKTTGAFIDNFIAGNGVVYPHDLCFGPDGKLYLCSRGSHEIKRYDPDSGAFLNNFVAAGSGGLNGPASMVFRTDGYLYVTSFGTSSVKRYNATTGAYVDDFIASGSGGLSGPDGLAFGPDGNWYVASYSTNNVKRYDGNTGAFLGDLDSGNAAKLKAPWGVTFH